MTNLEIARQLIEFAHFLEMRGESPYRVRAYRRGAETIMGLSDEIASLYYDRGIQGIRELPFIGSHLSYTIEGLICSGKFQTRDGAEDAFGVSRCLGCC
jgi:DNA polymerase (family 10)